LKRNVESRIENIEEKRANRHSIFYIPHSTFLVFALFATARPASAEIIDRVAVSVATSVITASEVDRAIRVIALQNGVNPDFQPANRRETAQRLVDQKLVRREMELSRYPQPDPSEVDPLLAQLRAKRYKSDGEFQAALNNYGVTEQDIRDAMLWELALVRFIEVRFRPAIQVTNQELEDYFEKVVKPTAQAAHPAEPVAFDDYRNRIEEKLAGERADQEVDNWLKEARKRTVIEVHEEAFE
jgi:hypothetical protein